VVKIVRILTIPDVFRNRKSKIFDNDPNHVRIAVIPAPAAPRKGEGLKKSIPIETEDKPWKIAWIIGSSPFSMRKKNPIESTYKCKIMTLLRIGLVFR
jgi:hypothetical protein